MKCTKIEPNIQKTLESVLKKYPQVHEIVQAIGKAGGRVLLVGGAVRDLLLGITIKDLDIEVHGLTLEQLESLLKNFGPVSLVGKVFGVLRLHGLDIDWSVPRTDAPGRKPKVHIDPAMSIQQAFARRDLTMNAMGIDLITYELIDPFNGYKDLQQNILRAPDPQLFIEDPLRFYRVMQFMSRFEMMPDATLTDICKTMDLSGVSTERIESEFEKLLLKSKRPSLGIRWLKDIGRLQEILPELAATIGIQQDPKWHPEGDVFEHTMQTIDSAARFVYDDNQTKLIVLYAALCHDLGKATTTQKIEGMWKSLEHERAGIPLTQELLERITRKNDIINAVSLLVKYHMVPSQLVDSDASLASYKRLAIKLAPHATLQLLADLTLADKQGRNPRSHEPLHVSDSSIEIFLRKAEEAQVRQNIEQPILHGRDLLDLVPPGPVMGKLLKEAYQIQLEEGIKDKEELKKRVITKMKQ